MNSTSGKFVATRVQDPPSPPTKKFAAGEFTLVRHVVAKQLYVTNVVRLGVNYFNAMFYVYILEDEGSKKKFSEKAVTTLLCRVITRIAHSFVRGDV